MFTRVLAFLLFGGMLGGEAVAQTTPLLDPPTRDESRPGGWEFTRWGMTLTEIIQSSSGRARLIQVADAAKFGSCSRTVYACRAHIPNYRAGSLVFDVLFGFDRSDLLRLVAMETQGADRFQVIERQFTAALGKPVGLQDGVTRIRTWDHDQKGNTISLKSEADIVVISYTPLGTPSL